jgi:hypothetical protein
VTLSDQISATHPLAARIPRLVWHTLGLVAAAALAWLIWRGYQAPDFLIDFSALRLC